MNSDQKEAIIKIGVIGCGAIGSRIAESVENFFQPFARLSGVYDIDPQKTTAFVKKINQPSIIRTSLSDLLAHADLIVEAVHANNTPDLLKQIILAQKHVMVMSVGQLLGHEDLFKIAQNHHCQIIVPSGAVAGIDAIRAAVHAGVDTLTLTTYKPPLSLKGAPYLIKKNIDITSIKKETVIFDGNVQDAVNAFPQNINVAATVALAAQAKNILRVRIVTSPEFTDNRHEIHVSGAFGQMTAVTKNFACPDNPKTSYLSVLSGIEALRSFCQKTKIGT